MKNIEDVSSLNVITLAYLGDAIYEVYVRESLIRQGIVRVEELQKRAVLYVSAKGQANILRRLMEENKLSLEEIEVVKRGRNYKRSSHPKHTDILTYKLSTGFETLIGYLYLSKKEDRLLEILNYIEVK